MSLGSKRDGLFLDIDSTDSLTAKIARIGSFGGLVDVGSGESTSQSVDVHRQHVDSNERPTQDTQLGVVEEESTEEIIDPASQCRADLEQINAALVSDPENADLLALKAQLEEMIVVLTGTSGSEQQFAAADGTKTPLLQADYSDGEEATDTIPEDAGPGERYQGSVAKFLAFKGYGFIEPAGSDNNQERWIKFSKDQVMTDGFKALHVGRSVSFRLGTDEQGEISALDVRAPNGKKIRNGLLTAAETFKGMRDYNEDRFTHDAVIGTASTMFAVYDGHGGAECSEFVAKHLPRNMQSAAKRNKDRDMWATIDTAFRDTDDMFNQHAKSEKNMHKVGSTANVCVFHGQGPGNLAVFVANLGDSRAVLCRKGKAVRLSEDHKPDRRDEKQRIEANGGYVMQVMGVWRVTKEAANLREQSDRVWLAVSRSFGDLSLKEPTVLVSSVPEVRRFEISLDDLFVAICCDGVYDVLTDQQLVDCIMPHMGDPQKAADAVIRKAYELGSEDNLTAVVVMFDWQLERLEELLVKWEAEEVARQAPKQAIDDVDIFG